MGRPSAGVPDRTSVVQPARLPAVRVSANSTVMCFIWNSPPNRAAPQEPGAWPFGRYRRGASAHDRAHRPPCGPRTVSIQVWANPCERRAVSPVARAVRYPHERYLRRLNGLVAAAHLRSHRAGAEGPVGAAPRELADLTGLSRTAVLNHLRALTEEGAVVAVGAVRSPNRRYRWGSRLKPLSGRPQWTGAPAFHAFQGEVPWSMSESVHLSTVSPLAVISSGPRLLMANAEPTSASRYVSLRDSTTASAWTRPRSSVPVPVRRSV
ncbi:helix-turn-helix domain-containing protein [Dactylosporangium sp. NPDC005555]|uniref:helix-turn-helix domain-containing protein n=1 Tax=Dactylosporangium sp. NPDC005555 TaxID=3154889 RepID=UPI0033AD9AFB